MLLLLVGPVLKAKTVLYSGLNHASGSSVSPIGYEPSRLGFPLQSGLRLLGAEEVLASPAA